MHNADELLTAKQVAELLGVRRQWVTKLASTKRLPVALKLPGGTGAWLFKRADVEAYQQQRLTSTGSPLAS